VVWIIEQLNAPDLWLGWIVSVAVACGIHGIAQFFSVTLMVPPHKQEKRKKSEFPQPFRFLDPLAIPLFLLTGWGWTRPYPLPQQPFENPFLYTVLFYIAGSVGNIALAGIISTLYTTILPSQVFAMAITINLYVGMANLIIPVPPFSLGRGLFAAWSGHIDKRIELAVIIILTVYTFWIFKTGDTYPLAFVQKAGDFMIHLLI